MTQSAIQKALEPFAKLCDEIDALRHEDDSTCEHRVKAADLRAAKAVFLALRTQNPSAEREAEQLTEHAAKWAKEFRSWIDTRLNITEAEHLETAMRQCVEEWIGETRQEPLPETKKEMAGMLKTLVRGK